MIETTVMVIFRGETVKPNLRFPTILKTANPLIVKQFVELMLTYQFTELTIRRED